MATRAQNKIRSALPKTVGEKRPLFAPSRTLRFGYIHGGGIDAFGYISRPKHQVISDRGDAGAGEGADPVDPMFVPQFGEIGNERRAEASGWIHTGASDWAYGENVDGDG